MDVLDDIVAGLELRSSLYFRAELAAPFAVAVPADRRRIRFHLVGSGRAWLELADAEVSCCEAGDLVLVPHGAAHVLASAPGREALPLEALLGAEPPEDGVLRHGGAGPVTELFCGHFEFDERVVHPLVESLPALIQLPGRSGADFAWLPTLVEAAESEARRDAPAQRAVARRLSEILFIQVLRAALAGPGPAAGLLAALADPRLGRALRCIHAEPAREWSLEALAARAGQSRSVFAERFRERIGRTPMRYLAEWRMQRARRLLADPELSVSEVGRQVGYASEAAFNRAFRDAFGEPPGRYRRSATSRKGAAPPASARARSPDAGAIPRSA